MVESPPRPDSETGDHRFGSPRSAGHRLVDRAAGAGQGKHGKSASRRCDDPAAWLVAAAAAPALGERSGAAEGSGIVNADLG